MKLYGLSRDEVYCLLNKRGCPLLTGGNKKKYRISAKDLNDWMHRLVEGNDRKSSRT